MAIKAIIFSKDRPMQLEACLSSLQYYCPYFCATNTFVVTPSFKTYFNELNMEINAITVNETEIDGGFYNTLKIIVEDSKDDDIILLGTDDVIYTNFFTEQSITSWTKDPQCIGLSLRIGENTQSCRFDYHALDPHPMVYFSWNWKSSSSHAGYPFDVSTGVYRASLLKSILSLGPELKMPNLLEDKGFLALAHNKLPESNQYKMAAFNGLSRACILPLNRVQDLYPNAVCGDDTMSAANLERLYKEGFRINWPKLFGFAPQDPFVGKEHFHLVRKEDLIL